MVRPARAKGRVVESGQVRAGGPIEIVSRPDHDVTVSVSFRALTIEPDLLPRLLAADALPPRAQGPGAAAYRVSASASMASAGWLASSQRTRGSRRNQDSWRRANRLVALTVSSRASSRVHSPSR